MPLADPRNVKRNTQARCVNIFSGKSQPNSVNYYLRAFVDDLLTLVRTGIYF